MKENTEISKIWVTGNSSYAIVIPKRFARELGLISSTHVIIEKIPGGVQVRKLEIGK